MGLAPLRPLIIPPVARLYIAPGNPLSRPLSQSRNFLLPCTPVNSAIKLRCIIQILLSNARTFGSRLYGILSVLPQHSFPSFIPVLLLFFHSFRFTCLLSFALFIVSLLFPFLYFPLHSRLSLPFHSLLGRTRPRSLLSRNLHTLRFLSRFFANPRLVFLNLECFLLALTLIIIN